MKVTADLFVRKCPHHVHIAMKTDMIPSVTQANSMKMAKAIFILNSTDLSILSKTTGHL